jgi:chromosome segregation ATPase
MADEPTKDDAPTPETGEKEPEKGSDEQRIPYSRFEEVNKRAKQAETELADLRQKILEFEDRDKSDLERARDRATRAESALEQLTGKVTAMEKGAWVRSAAAELNFHDPEDAVQHLRDQLGGLEDPRDAKRIVQRLAGSKKHLLREDKKDERPTFGRVFTGPGVPAQQQQNGQQPRTPAQMAAERELEFAQGLSQQLARFRDGWHNAGGF